MTCLYLVLLLLNVGFKLCGPREYIQNLCVNPTIVRFSFSCQHVSYRRPPYYSRRNHLSLLTTRLEYSSNAVIYIVSIHRSGVTRIRWGQLVLQRVNHTRNHPSNEQTVRFPSSRCRPLCRYGWRLRSSNESAFAGNIPDISQIKKRRPRIRAAATQRPHWAS